MKRSLYLLIATLLSASEGAPALKEGFERVLMRYERDACEAARKAAKENYDIVDIDVGCQCFKTDDHLWQCDIGFTYRESAQR